MRLAVCWTIVALLGIPAIASARQGSWTLPPPVEIAQQSFPLPPGDIPQDEGSPVRVAQDSSAQLLRIDRLENQVRGLTGQIEQMQFQQRKLEEQLRKMQEYGQQPVPPSASGATKPVFVPGTKRPGSGDAFDPNANPAAPGTPRPLGPPYGQPAIPQANVQPPATPPRQIIPQGPLGGDEIDPSKPVDIVPGTGATVPPRTVYPLPGSAQPIAGGNPPVISGTQPGTTAQVPLVAVALDDYKQGLALYNQGQYAEAETMLAGYVQKNPRGRAVPDALFYIGETFFKRQRQREAAEQYLKVSTDYSKSTRAPDALVRLGMSLNAMGAKEQACATFGEVGRKYPEATNAVSRAARETTRAKC